MTISATGLAFSASAAASASAAQTAARRAECHAVLGNYNSQTASIEMARDYASCVYVIHGSGEPLSAGLVILIKLAIVLAFVGAIGGAVYGWREEREVFSAGMYSLALAVAGPLALLMALLITAGIAFLIS